MQKVPVTATASGPIHLTECHRTASDLADLQASRLDTLPCARDRIIMTTTDHGVSVVETCPKCLCMDMVIVPSVTLAFPISKVVVMADTQDDASNALNEKIPVYSVRRL